jgi:hypothetical protein
VPGTFHFKVLATGTPFGFNEQHDLHFGRAKP